MEIVLESHVPSMGTPEPLFQRIVRYLAVRAGLESIPMKHLYVKQIHLFTYIYIHVFISKLI